ncbi:MAG: hypothetical protein JO264_20260 [Acidisphaera sp.]|nr:hypothetical protein [Acidisphaera sp.]
MVAKDETINKIELIARIHHVYKPKLELTLQNSVMTEYGKSISGYTNEYEMWVRSLGDKHFDMTTIIRLASEIELGLKRYYMERKGYSSFADFKNDPNVSAATTCQRMESSKAKNSKKTKYENVVTLFKGKLDVSLDSIAKFTEIRELFVLRHLYAHRVGIIDEHFLNGYQTVTGIDLRLSTDVIKAGYPDKDVVWFVNNAEISRLIFASQSFVKALP